MEKYPGHETGAWLCQLHCGILLLSSISKPLALKSRLGSIFAFHFKVSAACFKLMYRIE